jgi:hypothetical protein
MAFHFGSRRGVYIDITREMKTGKGGALKIIC